jgi:hypothetical protein
VAQVFHLVFELVLQLVPALVAKLAEYHAVDSYYYCKVLQKIQKTF